MERIIKAIGWILGTTFLISLLAATGIGIYNSGKFQALESQTQPSEHLGNPASSDKLQVLDSKSQTTGVQGKLTLSSGTPTKPNYLKELTINDRQPSIGPKYTYSKPSSISNTTPKATIKRNSGSWDTYNQLKSTCNYWTKAYNSDKKERSRLFMNSACRDATNYAKNELNTNTGQPNYVAYRPKKQTGGSAFYIGSPEDSKQSKQSKHSSCDVWKAELSRIQSRMRQGYTNSHGDYLREKYNKLSSKISSGC